MSLVTNKSESERIQKIKDRTLYANYLATQTKFQGGCDPIAPAIQSGSGASKEASLVTEIRLGARYTTSEEAAAIVLRNSCAVAPAAPTNVVAIPGDGEAIVSWTAPSDGGSAITFYTIISSPGGITRTSTTTSVIVTGLTNLTSYTFTVIASNARGNSSASVASSAVLPRVTLYSSNGDTLSGWTTSGVPTVDNAFGNPSPSIKVLGANTSIRRSVAASGQINGTNTTYEFDAYIITKRFWFKFGCDSAGANGPSLTFLTDAKNGLSESTGLWGYSAGTMPDTNITVSLNRWYRFKIQCAAGTNNTVWYLDGVLQGTNTYTYAGNGTYLGFIVDNGSAYVDNIVIYQGIV